MAMYDSLRGRFNNNMFGSQATMRPGVSPAMPVAMRPRPMTGDPYATGNPAGPAFTANAPNVRPRNGMNFGMPGSVQRNATLPEIGMAAGAIMSGNRQGLGAAFGGGQPSPAAMPPRGASTEALTQQLRSYVNPAANAQPPSAAINRQALGTLNSMAGNRWQGQELPQQMLAARTGSHFVDRGGQLQPRVDTSGARNVLAGQPESASTNMRPLNIPGRAYNAQGQMYKPYGPNGIEPGANRNLNPVEAAMDGMSPDDFRVATGGRAMIPAENVGGGVGFRNANELTSFQQTAMNRMARRAGVPGSMNGAWFMNSPRAQSMIQSYQTRNGVPIKNGDQPVEKNPQWPGQHENWHPPMAMGHNPNAPIQPNRGPQMSQQQQPSWMQRMLGAMRPASATMGGYNLLVR